MMRHDDDDDRRLLRDGEKLVVNMMMMDSVQKAVAASMFDASLHRPGPRYASDEQRAAADKAYQEMKARASRAWASPERRQADSEAACEIGRMLSMDEVQEIRDRSYFAMLKRAQEMWKQRP
jgi:hypothetical protein